MQPEQQENLVGRIGRWTTILWIAASLAALPWQWRLAAGLLLGGGIGLAMFQLYRWLAPALLSAPSRRRALLLLWLVWTVKLPVLGLLLYFALSRGVASPIGVGLGIGLLPAVATALAVRTAVGEARRGMQLP